MGTLFEHIHGVLGFLFSTFLFFHFLKTPTNFFFFLLPNLVSCVRKDDKPSPEKDFSFGGGI